MAQRRGCSEMVQRFPAPFKFLPRTFVFADQRGPQVKSSEPPGMPTNCYAAIQALANRWVSGFPALANRWVSGFPALANRWVSGFRLASPGFPRRWRIGGCLASRWVSGFPWRIGGCLASGVWLPLGESVGVWLPLSPLDCFLPRGAGQVAFWISPFKFLHPGVRKVEGPPHRDGSAPGLPKVQSARYPKSW